MQLFHLVLIVALCCTAGTPLVKSERILVVMMIGSKSHRLAFEPLFQELGQRGHQLTILSYSPGKPTENITEIGGPTIYEILGVLPDAYQDRINNVPFGLFSFGKILGKVCENYFQKPEVSYLLTQKFDLVMVDAYANECSFGFIHQFKPAPVILLSPMPPPSWVTPYLGIPSNPSFTPMTFSQYCHTSQMTFVNRAQSFLEYLRFHLTMKQPYFRDMETTTKEYFPDTPSAEEFYSGASLLLSNSHASFQYPMLHHLDIVEVGGMNCRPAQELPKDLREFLDGSGEDGFIYFSMGSYLPGVGMPAEYRNALLASFAKLKQRVLWKYEAETLPNLPTNVKLVRWAPQQDVLGHKNIRIFITQAGLLSIYETIYHEVPVIAIPILVDQDANIQRAMELGFALKLDLVDITEQKMSGLIQKILTDSSFRKQAKVVSERFRVRPEDPLRLAVFWTEYILKFKGAPFLRSVSRELNFVQYYSLDVIFLLAFIPVSGITLVFVVFKFLNNRLVTSNKHVKEE